MTPELLRHADKLSEAVVAMLSQGYIPVVLVGCSPQGHALARAIDPELTDAERVRSIMCRIVVGDIEPDLLEK